MESWANIKRELGELFSARALKDLSGLTEESRAELREDAEYLRRLVIGSRMPRFAVVGGTDVPLQPILSQFGVSQEHWEVRETLGHGRWYDHQTPFGTLRLADLRTEGDDSWLRALDYEQPDVVLGVAASDDTDVEAVADELIDALDRVEARWGEYPAAVISVVRSDEGRTAGDFKTIQALKDAFVARGFPRDFVDIVPAVNAEKLAQRIVVGAPPEIRVALARMTDDVATKRKLADDVIRVAASIAAAIATIPIPVADIVPITSVQMTMVAGIAYLSGRTVDVRNLSEFLAAVGLNVGAGLALRSLVRTMAKLIPVAGSLVSAAVAAGATRMLGQAAVRHYIR